MERFIKFKRLEKEGNNVTVQIDYVKWGKYTDCRGNKVLVERGIYERFHILNDFSVQSVNLPELGFEFLFLQGEDKSSDNRLTYYEFSSKARAEKVFKALQSIAIHEKQDIDMELYEADDAKYKAKRDSFIKEIEKLDTAELALLLAKRIKQMAEKAYETFSFDYEHSSYYTGDDGRREPTEDAQEECFDSFQTDIEEGNIWFSIDEDIAASILVEHIAKKSMLSTSDL